MSYASWDLLPRSAIEDILKATCCHASQYPKRPPNTDYNTKRDLQTPNKMAKETYEETYEQSSLPEKSSDTTLWNHRAVEDIEILKSQL